jgi:hypothetical protein
MLFPGDPGNKPRLVDYAPIGAPSPLMGSRGEKLKAQLAPRRENEEAWLFEM